MIRRRLAVLALFAVQALYALGRGLVNPVWGFVIVIYNIIIATVGIVRYMVAHGHSPAEPFVALLAAQSLASVAGVPG